MIVAIIGSPLSGKTTLLKELSNRGIKVFSADTFVNQIYKKDQSGYNIIKEELGEDFVNEESVDKRALAIWATDDENLLRLNELIHPLIKDYLEGKDGFAAELPIITNSPVKFNYDKLILVKASEDKIIERFKERSFANDEFIKKIIKDWSNEIKADFVIDTTNGLQEADISNIIRMINHEN